MDKGKFVENVNALCDEKNIYPTTACKESGVGPSFLSDIKRGRVPGVDKFQLLAQYLGVTTSELLGETIKQATGEAIDIPFKEADSAPAPLPPKLQSLSTALEQLNEEGQEKLLDYAADLVASGRYIKSRPAGLGQEA